MKGFWAKTWRSPTRSTVAGAFISALIASILYGFNWHTFYDTRTNFAKDRAELIARDITTLALATQAAPGNDAKFKTALEQYLAPRRQRITVSRNNLWKQTNGTPVDESRTLVAADFTLEQAAGPGGRTPVHVAVSIGIRPRYIISLARAWSFSILSYIDSPENWWAQSLYNRSIPLYGYLLTILIVGFGTIRALYKNQQELVRLEQEILEAATELDQFRDRHSEEIALFRKQMDHTRHQREDAIRNRDQLTFEMIGIEREYLSLIDTSPAIQGDDPRLAEAANRKTQVERVLTSYNVKVDYFERELADTRSELTAAEQLFQEVEARRETLNAKLQARNREIRKLHKLVQETHKKMRTLESDQHRLAKKNKLNHRNQGEWKETQDTLEEQLGVWIKKSGHAKVNFSSHGKVGLVEQQFQKIDPAFIDRYFTHINNTEYERGNRCLIRVITDPSEDTAPPSGKLIVCLDDDAGRTLAMRFETRKDSPDPIHIGFVLALLLQAKCRDFHHFSIRTR